MFGKFGFTGTSTFFPRIGEILHKGFFIGCATIGTLLLAVGGPTEAGAKLPEESSDLSFETAEVFYQFLDISFLFGGVLFLIGAIGMYFDQDKQQKEIRNSDTLRMQLNHAQEAFQSGLAKTRILQTDFAQNWLSHAFKNLKLDSFARVTIYYEVDREFILLARYSCNPDISEVHMQKFPIDKGIISQAWRHGIHIEKDAPSYDDDASIFEGFMTKKYEYGSRKINSLSMKSCRFIAIAIKQADHNIGVILFESTDKGFLNGEEQCDKIEKYCTDNHGQLSKFIREAISIGHKETVGESPENELLQDLNEEGL